MTTQITHLTPGQEEMLIQVRDEWLAIGLSTEPADKAEAEKGVHEAYTAAGLTPPEIILWLSSPGAALDALDSTPSVIAEATGATAPEPDAGAKAPWYESVLYGQHNAGYYGYYDAMRRLGVTGLEPLDGQIRVARSAGWWWCFSGYAIVTDRPEYLERDANGALHSATGMAIRYRDGWGFHCWHGRRVPAWVIGEPSLQRISAEQNTEIRRCAIESMGWDKFTEEAQLAQVGKSVPDPGNPGQSLALYDVPERLWGTPIRLLLCTNGTAERDGTRRRYGLTTPVTVSDPVEAAAWTYRISKADYAKAQRRS
jgi:uncharacterized protein DUF6745